MPHWTASLACSAACSGDRPSPSASDSTVRTERPSTWASGTRQDVAGCRRRSTVQAPQNPSSQLSACARQGPGCCSPASASSPGVGMLVGRAPARRSALRRTLLTGVALLGGGLLAAAAASTVAQGACSRSPAAAVGARASWSAVGSPYFARFVPDGRGRARYAGAFFSARAIASAAALPVAGVASSPRPGPTAPSSRWAPLGARRPRAARPRRAHAALGPTVAARHPPVRAADRRDPRLPVRRSVAAVAARDAAATSTTSILVDDGAPPAVAAQLERSRATTRACASCGWAPTTARASAVGRRHRARPWRARRPTPCIRPGLRRPASRPSSSPRSPPPPTARPRRHRRPPACGPGHAASIAAARQRQPRPGSLSPRRAPAAARRPERHAARSAPSRAARRAAAHRALRGRDAVTSRRSPPAAASVAWVPMPAIDERRSRARSRPVRRHAARRRAPILGARRRAARVAGDDGASATTALAGHRAWHGRPGSPSPCGSPGSVAGGAAAAGPPSTSGSSSPINGLGDGPEWLHRGARPAQPQLPAPRGRRHARRARQPPARLRHAGGALLAMALRRRLRRPRPRGRPARWSTGPGRRRPSAPEVLRRPTAATGPTSRRSPPGTSSSRPPSWSSAAAMVAAACGSRPAGLPRRGRRHPRHVRRALPARRPRRHGRRLAGRALRGRRDPGGPSAPSAGGRPREPARRERHTRKAVATPGGRPSSPGPPPGLSNLTSSLARAPMAQVAPCGGRDAHEGDVAFSGRPSGGCWRSRRRHTPGCPPPSSPRSPGPSRCAPATRTVSRSGHDGGSPQLRAENDTFAQWIRLLGFDHDRGDRPRRCGSARQAPGRARSWPDRSRAASCMPGMMNRSLIRPVATTSRRSRSSRRLPGSSGSTEGAGADDVAVAGTWPRLRM